MSSVCLSDAGLCHGTAISVAGAGALIIGSSGQGKSSLALELISRGGRLVSDDQVHVSQSGGAVWLAPPAPIRGLIEARGIGVLRAPVASKVRLAVVVDMDREEPDRLPPFREINCAGASFPLIHGARQGHLAAALMVLLCHGRAQ